MTKRRIHSCSGSVLGAVEDFVDEDWLQDSVVIDIGGWSDELDVDAVQRQIADADSGNSTLK